MTHATPSTPSAGLPQPTLSSHPRAAGATRSPVIYRCSEETLDSGVLCLVWAGSGFIDVHGPRVDRTVIVCIANAPSRRNRLVLYQGESYFALKILSRLHHGACVATAVGTTYHHSEDAKITMGTG